MKTIPRIRIILASLLLAGAASAVPIAGSISIVSFADPAFSFDLTANTVTFGSGANAIVSNRSGSYSIAIPLLIPTVGVHYNSFAYSPLSGAISPIWATTAPNLGLASFDLSSISFIDENPGVSLTLRGDGVAKLAGFDNTFGTWSFTATQNGTSFGWDSINSTRVPDGGATLALLGMSVLGLGGVRRFLPALKK